MRMLRTDHGDGWSGDLDARFEAHQDRIADDQAEREAAELRAERRGFEVGDRVRVGNGKTEWVIDGFGRGRLEGMAHLEAVAGFAATTVEISRLREAS